MAQQKKKYVASVFNKKAVMIDSRFKRYLVEVDNDGNNRTLRVQTKNLISSFKDNVVVPLRGAIIERPKGFWSTQFDMGDVSVTSSTGKKIICERIRGVEEFATALEGRHPKLQPDLPLWNKGLSDSDLEDFAVAIPAIPNSYYYYLNHTFGGGVYFSNAVPFNKDGWNDGWTKKGDYLTRIVTPSPHKRGEFYTHDMGLKMPFSGKVLSLGVSRYERWDPKTNWPESREMGSDEYKYLLVQPLKGEFTKHAISQAYDHITNFLFLEAISKRKYTKYIPDYKKYIPNLERERRMIYDANFSPKKIRRDIIDPESKRYIEPT